MTPDRTLVDSVRAHLEAPSWEGSAEGTVAVVASVLGRMDRSVVVESTGYFNHTFIPDLILRWEKRSKERRVFLRLDAGRQNLLSALDSRAVDESVIVGLEDPPEEEWGDELGDLAASRETMVVDLPGVSGLQPQGGDFDDVVPSSMLRGGLGTVQLEQASELQASGHRFFRAASVVDAESISAPAQRISMNLSAVEHERLVGLGRVLWQARGGSPQDFPIQTTLSSIDSMGLRLLLETSPEQTSAFWRAIGQSSDPDLVYGLALGHSSNLHAFVNANADRIRCKALVVAEGELHGSESLEWSSHPGTIALTGRDFVAYIAQSVETVRHLAREHTMPTTRAVGERLASRIVESVTTETQDGTRWMVENENGLEEHERVEFLDWEGGHRGLVTSIALRVAGTHVDCRFPVLESSARTTALLPVSSLVQAVLPVLWHLDEGDAHSLEGMYQELERLAVEERASGQLSFD